MKPCKYGDYNSILNLDFAHTLELISFAPSITFLFFNFCLAVYWSFSHWDDLSINLFFVCTFRKLFRLGLSGRILLFLLTSLLPIGHYAFSFALLLFRIQFLFLSQFVVVVFFKFKTCLSLSLIINSVSNTVPIQVNSLANDLISSFSSIDFILFGWFVHHQKCLRKHLKKRIW